MQRALVPTPVVSSIGSGGVAHWSRPFRDRSLSLVSAGRPPAGGRASRPAPPASAVRPPSERPAAQDPSPGPAPTEGGEKKAAPKAEKKEEKPEAKAEEPAPAKKEEKPEAKAEEPAPPKEEKAAEAPKAEEPKAEAPKAEEPKAEAPKAEAPAVDTESQGGLGGLGGRRPSWLTLRTPCCLQAVLLACFSRGAGPGGGRRWPGCCGGQGRCCRDVHRDAQRMPRNVPAPDSEQTSCLIIRCPAPAAIWSFNERYA